MDYNRLDVPLMFNGQTQKDCKKSTPDYSPVNPKKGLLQVGFMVKDVVMLDGVKSLLNKKILTGECVFDSYDKYDNTCYVSKDGLTWNVLLSDLTLIPPIINKK